MHLRALILPAGLSQAAMVLVGLMITHCGETAPRRVLASIEGCKCALDVLR